MRMKSENINMIVYGTPKNKLIVEDATKAPVNGEAEKTVVPTETKKTEDKI